uniref:RNA helicase n=1 Tax=Pristionchus pacificus TaxID=54126 RepID=A0A2A6BSA9_PRIPA|eukprot:PDM68842.1 ddx-27 [Pristionchus pacificus]
MSSLDGDEVEKLREQVRILSSQNSALTKEVSTLKEKLSVGTSEAVSKAVFSVKATMPVSDTLKSPVSTKTTMMCGVEVKMLANYLPNNEGSRQLWFELTSPSKHNAAFLAKITYQLPTGVYFDDEAVHFEYLQLEEGLTQSAAIPASHMKNTKGLQVGLNVNAKLIRIVKESAIAFSDDDEMANVKVGDEIIPVNISYISAWSEFFRGYFASKMKESIEENCAASEFRDLLDVIYPSCKPISHWNVKSQIRLADRFIMPSLSRKCEIFLSDRSMHNFSDSELLKLADEYRLAFMKTIIIECTTGDQLHKNVIAREEYKSYSEELKKAIDTRYVESKVPERNAMVLPAAAFRMDEAELLGEADGEATRQISQEEEDALLNGEFEPTTATAAAAADSPAAIFDPPAGVADPTAVADEDDLMNDDSESSKSSEERREPSQDVPISSNASDTDEIDLPAHRVTAEDLRNSAYIRSMLRVEKQRREATLERFSEKMNRMKERATELYDEQLRRLAELQEEQSNISKQLKEVHSRFAHLCELPAKEQPPPAQPLVLPNTMMMRRSAPSAAGAQRLHQLQQQRNLQRISDVDVGPSTSSGVGRRLSSDNAMPSTSRVVTTTVMHQRARKSTGGGISRPGPSNGLSRAAVQSQQAQAIVNAQQAVAAASATAAARMLAAASSPLQSRQLQQPSAIKVSPHANQTASSVPQSQQAAAISAALAAGSRSAATPPAVQQKQLQMSRKRPHGAGDAHPAHQQQQPVVLQTRNGQLQPLQHAQPLRQGMEEMHTKMIATLQAACRLETQMRDARTAPRPFEEVGFPTTDTSFVVPPDGSALRSKICVNVPAGQLARPQKRPSTDLPIASVNTKGKHAPRVVFASDYRDFADSGKLSGTVHFTPSSDWPETTARVCIFFYIGTQNTGVWSRSEFATADCKEKDANGNFNEATVRFTINVDKAKYAKNESGTFINPNAKFEKFGVVPVACAGAQIVRGDEATFDCEALEQAGLQSKYDVMKRNMRAFIEQDKRKLTGGRPMQQQQPPAARPPRPAAAADDDIIIDTRFRCIATINDSKICASRNEPVMNLYPKAIAEDEKIVFEESSSEDDEQETLSVRKRKGAKAGTDFAVDFSFDLGGGPKEDLEMKNVRKYLKKSVASTLEDKIAAERERLRVENGEEEADESSSKLMEVDEELEQLQVDAKDRLREKQKPAGRRGTKEQDAFFSAEGRDDDDLLPTTFEELMLSRPTLKAISGAGFTEPTPIQARTIPVALAGRSRATPTTRVLVLVPTRELAIQVFQVFRKLSVHSQLDICLCADFMGTSYHDAVHDTNVTQKIIFSRTDLSREARGLDLKTQEAALRASPDVVVATPGRLLDHLHNTPTFTLSTIEVLVLDEADRMLEEAFKEQMGEIIKMCARQRQTLLFSATMTDQIDELASMSLQKPVRIFINENTDTALKLRQEFIRLRAGHEKDREAIVAALVTRTFSDRTLVFVRTKRECMRVQILLGLLGLKTAQLHSSLTQTQRVEALAKFRRAEIDCLICTDLASRGLDIEQVHTVLNMHMPRTLKSYIHRVGRTARAGKAGRSISLVAEDDRKILKEIVKSNADRAMKQRLVAPEVVQAYKDKIEALEESIETIEEDEKVERQLRIAEQEQKNVELKLAGEKTEREGRVWFKKPTELDRMKKKEERKRLAKEERRKQMAEKTDDERAAERTAAFQARKIKRDKKPQRMRAVVEDEERPARGGKQGGGGGGKKRNASSFTSSLTAIDKKGVKKARAGPADKEFKNAKNAHMKGKRKY